MHMGIVSFMLLIRPPLELQRQHNFAGATKGKLSVPLKAIIFFQFFFWRSAR